MSDTLATPQRRKYSHANGLTNGWPVQFSNSKISTGLNPDWYNKESFYTKKATANCSNGFLYYSIQKMRRSYW